MGVIRFGTDRIVAVIDSTQAGRNVREWLGDSGRYDIPIVASLNDALGFLPRANGLLIGIAPTGGRLPDDWRAGDPRRDPLGARHPLRAAHVPRPTTPSSPRPRGSSGVRLVDYRRPPERYETSIGRRHAPGKRVLLTVGTDCAIGKMSVALELRRAATAAGRTCVVRAHRPDRDDDRGLGRRRRPGDRGLPPGHGRVAGRGGGVARRLGHRRGAGEPGPPGLQLGDAGAHPRHHAARDGDGPQAGHGRPRLRPPARRALPDRLAARRSSRSTSRWRGSWRRRRSSRWRSTRRSSPTRPRPAGSSRRSRRRPGLPTDDPVRFGGDALWREIEAASRRCRGSTAHEPRTPPGRRAEPADDARPAHADAPAAAARPVRHRALVARRGTVGHDGRGRRCATRPTARTGRSGSGEGYPDPFYGDTPETMAAVAPLPARGARAGRGRPARRPGRRAGRARGRRRADDRGDRPPRRAQVRARHRAPRPRRQAAGPAGPRPRSA